MRWVSATEVLPSTRKRSWWDWARSTP